MKNLFTRLATRQSRQQHHGWLRRIRTEACRPFDRIQGAFPKQPAAFLRQNFRLLLAPSLVLGMCGLINVSIPAAETAKDLPLPPAKEIIGRFVKEIGGKAAFDKINSQHAEGKIEMAGQGLTGKLEVFAKRPDKLVIKINLPGVGDLWQGFDGQVGWSINPLTGPMILEGKMLDHAREEARFDSVLHEQAEFNSMETVRRTQFEGKDAYEVKLVRKSGQEVTEYYDVETGLLTGSAEVQESPLGPINATGITADYRKFGEALFATKLTQKMGPLAQVMTFSSMDFNKVEDSAFALPDQIKALLKK